jgi:hypothetical protein
MREDDLAEYNEYMKELNEVVKQEDLLAYTSLKRLLDTHAVLRLIEELEVQMELAEIGNSYTRLRDRIKELKQER